MSESSKLLLLQVIAVLLAGALGIACQQLITKSRDAARYLRHCSTLEEVLENARNEFTFSLRREGLEALSPMSPEPLLRAEILDQRSPRKLSLRDAASSHHGIVAIASIENSAIVLRSPIDGQVFEGSVQ